jgi:hypothetical protein
VYTSAHTPISEAAAQQPVTVNRLIPSSNTPTTQTTPLHSPFYCMREICKTSHSPSVRILLVLPSGSNLNPPTMAPTAVCNCSNKTPHNLARARSSNMYACEEKEISNRARGSPTCQCLSLPRPLLCYTAGYAPHALLFLEARRISKGYWILSMGIGFVSQLL